MDLSKAITCHFVFSHQNRCIFRTENKKILEITSIRAQGKDIAITQVNTKDLESKFSCSKNSAQPEHIIGILRDVEGIEAVQVIKPHFDQLSNWYFKSSNPQMKTISSIEIRGKIINFTFLKSFPSPPPPPPPPVQSDELSDTSEEVKYFIDVFHDAENCPCPGNVDAKSTFKKTIKKVLTALIGKDKVNTIDITSDVIVKWNFVISPDRSNDYNQPSEKFLKDLSTVLGGILIDPRDKNNAVDTKIIDLMLHYQHSFDCLPKSAKKNRVVLLISGDKDYSSIISSLRQKKHNVMVIWNHSKTNDAYLDKILEDYRLGKWQNFLTYYNSSTQSGKTSIEDLSLGYDSLQIAAAAPPPPSAITSPNNNINPNNKRIISLTHWYKYNFINSYLRDFLDQMIVKISPNVVLSYHPSPSSLPEIHLTYRTLSSKELRNDDTLNDDPVAALNLSQEFVDNVLGTIKGCKPREFAVSKEALLANLDLKTIRESLQINWTIRNKGFEGEEKEDPKQLIMKLPESWLKSASDMIIRGRQEEKVDERHGKSRSESRDSRHRGKAQNKGSSTHRSKSESKFSGSPNSQKYDNNNNNKQSASGRGGKSNNNNNNNNNNVGKIDSDQYTNLNQSEDSIIKEMVEQHMLNYFSLTKSSYLVNIFRNHAIPHVSLIFKKEVDRNKVLSSPLSSSVRLGVNFFKTLNSQENDDTEVIQSSSIILYYRVGATTENQIEEYFTKIKSYEKSIETIELFPDPKKGPPQYRSNKEKYFFSNAIWDTIQSEVDYLAPSVILSLIKQPNGYQNEPKTLIQIKGLDTEVKIVIKHLEDRCKKILHQKFQIRPERQSTKLTDALKTLLKNIKIKYLEKHKNLNKILNVESKDEINTEAIEAENQSEITHFVATNNSTKSLVTYFQVGKSHVEIMGVPECRDLWQPQIDIINELIEHFAQSIVVVNDVKINLKKLKTDFDLYEASFDPNHKSVVLYGINDRVQNATSYIQQSLAGESAVSVLVKCNNPQYPLHLQNKLPKYFSLSEPNHQLSNVRDELIRTFKERERRNLLSAAITLNSKEYTLLTIQCPERLSNQALEEANRLIAELIAPLKYLVIPKSERVINWLNQSDLTDLSKCALIELISPDDEDDGDNDDNKYDTINEEVIHSVECDFGPIKVLALTCELVDLLNFSSDKCDCIINSANSRLQHGGGIARAIADLAGPVFLTESQRVLNSINGEIPVGASVTTDGCDLRNYGVSTVVHCIPPVYVQNGSNSTLRFQLRNSIKSALTEANKNGKCIAIPGIGTGIFRWPLELASVELIAAVSEWVGSMRLSDIKIEKIIFFDNNFSLTSILIDDLQNFTDGNFNPTPSPNIQTITPPVDFFIPKYQWFRLVWPWERGNLENVSAKNILSGDKSYVVAPYDYDQVVQLEKSFANGEKELRIIGDADSKKI